MPDKEENWSVVKSLSLCVSRKAIAKSGLHHLPCQPSTSSLSRTDPEASIRSTVDWTVSVGVSMTQQGSEKTQHNCYLLLLINIVQLSSSDVTQNNTPSCLVFCYHPICSWQLYDSLKSKVPCLYTHVLTLTIYTLLYNDLTCLSSNHIIENNVIILFVFPLLCAFTMSLFWYLCRIQLCMEIISGLRRMYLETTVMLGSNTVLPELWLVPDSDLSSPHSLLSSLPHSETITSKLHL